MAKFQQENNQRLRNILYRRAHRMDLTKHFDALLKDLEAGVTEKNREELLLSIISDLSRKGA